MPNWVDLIRVDEIQFAGPIDKDRSCGLSRASFGWKKRRRDIDLWTGKCFQCGKQNRNNTQQKRINYSFHVQLPLLKMGRENVIPIYYVKIKMLRLNAIEWREHDIRKTNGRMGDNRLLKLWDELMAVFVVRFCFKWDKSVMFLWRRVNYVFLCDDTCEWRKHRTWYRDLFEEERKKKKSTRPLCSFVRFFIRTVCTASLSTRPLLATQYL